MKAKKFLKFEGPTLHYFGGGWGGWLDVSYSGIFWKFTVSLLT